MNFNIVLVIAIFATAVSAKAINKDEKIIDELTDAVNSLYNDVLLPALTTQVQNLALLGAQLLAGFSQTGFGWGKRDGDAKIIDELTDAVNSLYNDVLLPALTTQVQNLALLGAQLLAGFSQTGFGWGKRELDAKIIDELTDAVNSLYNDVLLPALTTQVQNLALLGAQLLAGFSQTGFGWGKRDEIKGFFDDLLDSLSASLLPVVDTALQSLALTGAQLLAGIAINGIGKREDEIKGFFDDLLDSLSASLLPVVDTALQSLALTGAQLLAGIAINGIGKRDDLKGFFDDLLDSLSASLLPVVDTALQSLALTGAQLLAGIAINGIGKRDEMKGFFDDLLDSLSASLLPVVDTALQSLALTGAQLLAGIAINGIGK